MQTYFNTKVKKMHLAKKKREECKDCPECGGRDCRECNKEN